MNFSIKILFVLTLLFASLSSFPLYAQSECGPPANYYMLWIRGLPATNVTITATLYGENGPMGSLHASEAGEAFNLNREAMREAGGEPLVVTATNGRQTWVFTSPANSLLRQESDIIVTDINGNVLCRGIGNDLRSSNWTRVD